MAKAFKCDCCLELYPNEPVATLNLAATNQYMYNVGASDECRERELCPGCAIAVANFFRARLGAK